MVLMVAAEAELMIPSLIIYPRMEMMSGPDEWLLHENKSWRWLSLPDRLAADGNDDEGGGDGIDEVVHDTQRPEQWWPPTWF